MLSEKAQFPFLDDPSAFRDDIPGITSDLRDRPKKIVMIQSIVAAKTKDNIGNVLKRMVQLEEQEEVIWQSNDLWPSSRLEDLEALAGHIVTPLKNMDFLRIDQK